MDGVRIPLTRGLFALVDPADAGRVNRYKWCAGESKGAYYAKRGDYSGGKHRTVRMHTFIVGAGPGVDVDHIDGDGLNNRRGNLRICRHIENTANQRKPSSNTSGYKGVYFLGGKWAAKIRTRYLGLFDTAQEAACAYDTEARRVFGEFARLNFPSEALAVAPRLGALRRNSSSGYRGVSFRKSEHKWTARLNHGGRRLFLGYFESAESAAAAIAEKRAELDHEDQTQQHSD